MTEPEFILPPREAPVFGRLMMVLGLGGVVFSAVVGATSGGVFLALVAASFPALLGVLPSTGGALLAARRGGVAFEAEAIAFYGDSPNSAIRIPFGRIASVVAVAREEGDPATPIPVATAEIILDSGVRVLLAEAPHEEQVEPLARAVAERLRVPQVARGRTPGTRRTEGHAIRVGNQGALPRTLGVTAVSMLAAGSIAWLDTKNPAAAAFLGTPLLALGVVLGLLPVLKGRLTEHLDLFQDGRFTHEYRALGLRWGRREGRADPEGCVRIRQRGLLGATLEIVGHRRVQLVAGGVQGGRYSAEDLLRLGEAVEEWRHGE